MAELAFALSAAATAIGLVLACLYLWGGGGQQPRRAFALLHGVFGAAGLGVLLAGLGRMHPHSAMGTAGFGGISATLFGLALLLGLAIAGARWRGRPPAGALIGAHAGLAITGLVMLLTLIALGQAQS